MVVAVAGRFSPVGTGSAMLQTTHLVAPGAINAEVAAEKLAMMAKMRSVLAAAAGAVARNSMTTPA